MYNFTVYSIITITIIIIIINYYYYRLVIFKMYMITVGSKIKEPLKQYTPTSTYTLVRYYTPYLLSSKLHRDEGRANIARLKKSS